MYPNLFSVRSTNVHTEIENSSPRIRQLLFATANKDGVLSMSVDLAHIDKIVLSWFLSIKSICIIFGIIVGWRAVYGNNWIEPNKRLNWCKTKIFSTIIVLLFKAISPCPKGAFCIVTFCQLHSKISWSQYTKQMQIRALRTGSNQNFHKTFDRRKP